MKIKMKMILAALLAVIAVTAAFFGCSSEGSASGSASGSATGDAVVSESDVIAEEDMIFVKAIEENIAAFNSGDADVYMASMKLSADSAQATRAAYVSMISSASCTAQFDPEDFEVKSRTDTNAAVSATMIMTRVDAEGKETVMKYVIEHNLELVEEKWVITSSVPITEKDIEETAE